MVDFWRVGGVLPVGGQFLEGIGTDTKQDKRANECTNSHYAEHTEGDERKNGESSTSA